MQTNNLKRKRDVLTLGQMLFSLKEFEHFFSETTLRKGLQLFEAGKIAFLPEKIKENRIFQVGMKRISINKRGDKILAYSCTCSKSYYCEHLAALAFYFQRDAFNGKPDKRNPTPHKNPSLLDVFGLALKETNDKELKKFFQRATSEINSGDLKKIFDVSVAGDFELYCLKWKISFQSYFHGKPLTDSDIDEILYLINSDKNKTDGSRLALLIELSEVLGLRFTGNEGRIKSFCKSLLSNLGQQFSKGLNETSKVIWMRATLILLKTDHLFHNGLLFILPRTLNLSKSRSFFTELSVLLENRKYKRKYSEYFDNLMIAKWMLAIRQKQVLKTPFIGGSDKEGVEYSIAISEMFFCSGKIKKGFESLESVYDKWTIHQKRHGSFFRDYVIEKASEYRIAEKEKFFLKESLLYDLYVAPHKLHHYLNMLDKNKQRSEIDNIVNILKNDRSPLSQDKINTLLFETKQFDDLIEVLKKQNNAFLTLHKVVLLKWPYHDENILNIYLKQLMEAFSDRRVFHRPEDLFVFSMEYLDKLPIEERERAKEKILNKLGGKSVIHRFVSELFENKS